MLKCGICSRSFANKLNLHRHFKKCHPKRHKARSTLSVTQGDVAHDVLSQTEPENGRSYAWGGDSDEEYFSPLASSPAVQDGGANTERFVDQYESSVAVGEDVSNDVFQFYDSFEDRSEPLYNRKPDEQLLLTSLNESCKDLLNHCTNNQMSSGEIASEWDLVSSLELRVPQQFRFVTNQFPTAVLFCNLVEKARKAAVVREGWQGTKISSPLGDNYTGVFRSAFDLMMNELKAAGGSSALQSFTLSHDHLRQRVFSAPWDSNAMMRYHLQHRDQRNARVVLIDLYCDGTTLSKSGSQSANTMRVRFSNIRGRSTEWHEIGIAPCIDTHGKECSKVELKRERLHLFQRFLFIALRDVIRASSVGVPFERGLLFPRVGMIVADQPQERAFFALKSADSFKDCSLCEMPSRVPEKVSNASWSTSVADKGAEQSGEVMKIQMSPEGAPARNVSQIVRNQLLLGLKAREPRQNYRTQDKHYKDAVRSARQELISVSAQEFPPALAAFHGLGTAPFALYESIGFDTLHVLDLFEPYLMAPARFSEVVATAPFLQPKLQ
ncbi:Zinc finger C2H2-type domain containing protein [Gracilaria domingensis]|nr:Zinc finger C2H2-type domain containing protein [Gracilaria domingensis]